MLLWDSEGINTAHKEPGKFLWNKLFVLGEHASLTEVIGQRKMDMQAFFIEKL